MGKVDDNKQQKLEALFKSAYELFLSQGIAKTSIHDIVQKAGVAKGTFYLYFKDKYEIRDRLIVKTAEKLFLDAQAQLSKTPICGLEDEIIFIVDYILEQMQRNKPILRFISKNLSWGVFSQALSKTEKNSDFSVMQFFKGLADRHPSVKLRAPDIMLFLIIELASSASYSTILDNDPINFQDLKPDLYTAIRAIIRSHVIEEG